MKITRKTIQINRVKFKIYLPNNNNLEVTISDRLGTTYDHTTFTLDTARERLAYWCRRGELFYTDSEEKRIVVNGNHVIRFQELSRTPLYKTVVITRSLLGTRRLYVLDDLPLEGEEEETHEEQHSSHPLQLQRLPSPHHP